MIEFIAPACEAAESIKPGVERGFASETPSQKIKKFQPALRATARNHATSAARFAGSRFLITIGPRVPLAKPRFTLGYILPPALRAKNDSR